MKSQGSVRAKLSEGQALNNVKIRMRVSLSWGLGYTLSVHTNTWQGPFSPTVWAGVLCVTLNSSSRIDVGDEGKVFEAFWES